MRPLFIRGKFHGRRLKKTRALLFGVCVVGVVVHLSDWKRREESYAALALDTVYLTFVIRTCFIIIGCVYLLQS